MLFEESRGEIGIDDRQRSGADSGDGRHGEEAVALRQFLAFVGVKIVLVTPIGQVDDLHFAEAEKWRASDDFGVGVERGAEIQEALKEGRIARGVDSAFALNRSKRRGETGGIRLEIVGAHEEIVEGKRGLFAHIVLPEIFNETCVAFSDVLEPIMQAEVVEAIRLIKIARIDLGRFVMHIKSVGSPERFPALGKAVEAVMREERRIGFGAEVGQTGPGVIRVRGGQDFFRALINDGGGLALTDRVAGEGKHEERTGKPKHLAKIFHED